MQRTRISQLIAAALLGLASGHSFALDVDAGDYTALPAGTNLGLVYYQNVDFGSAYSSGNRIPLNMRATGQIGIVRGVHFMEVGGYTIDPQFWIPFGSIKTKDDASNVAKLGNESGIGDLTVGGTVWVVNKPKEQNYVGLSAFLTLPTGSYESANPINELAENRQKLVLQAGWITPVADKVLLDLVGDVALSGKNDQYLGNKTLKQDPRYQLQAHFRYQLSAASDLRFGLSKTMGGDVKVNGVDSPATKSTDVTKFSIGGATFISPSVQLLATYGKDINVNDAFKEHRRLNLRVLKVF